MLVVHHLETSQSERIVWLCEELGLTYELVRHERDAETRLAPKELKRLHPYGTAPVIEDGALRLGKSGAIIEYIIHRYGEGRLAIPPDASNYGDYLYWFHFAGASLMPVILMNLLIETVGGGDLPLMRPRLARLETAYTMIEDGLQDQDYLAGAEFTAADLIMFFPLTTLRHLTGRSYRSSPNTLAWIERVASRPAYVQAMAKSDPNFVPLIGSDVQTHAVTR